MPFALDISNWKYGCNIEQLKNEGLVQLYAKATEGVNYVDPCLNKFYNDAHRLGIPFGVYHFASNKGSQPEQQAEDFYNAVKGLECQMRYNLDMEVDVTNICNYSDFVRRFINKFESLMGKSDICSVYASAYYARDNFDSDIKNRYPLWIAQYGVGPDEYMQTGFATICGHQYSEDESHCGMKFDSNTFHDSVMIGSICSQSFSNNTTQPIGKIAELQTILGVTVDNLWGPETWGAVQNVIAGIPYHLPQITTWIQLRLGGVADGIFGPDTETAVRSWQASHNLLVDGIAGPETIRSLALA